MTIEAHELDPVFVPRIKFPKRQKHHGKRRRFYEKLYQKDPCSYCNKEGGTADHIIPKSKGGRSGNNVTGACKSCNDNKADKDLLTFLLENKT